MNFRVVFSPKSYKQIKSLNRDLKERIKKASIEIGKNPWYRGTIKVRGYENIRRKRVGYRILYTVDKEKKEVRLPINNISTTGTLSPHQTLDISRYMEMLIW